jgi:glycosyltransferase involved in cell wall biosynthesis
VGVPQEIAAGRRLLIVVNVAWFFLSHRLAIATAARKAGYEVHVAAGGATREEVERIEAEGLVYHELDLERSARGLLKNAALLGQLVRTYRRLRPHVVHHVTIKPVMFGTLAARLARVPAVVNAVSGLGYVFTSGDGSRSTARRFVEMGYRACLRHPRMKFIFQNVDDRALVSRIVGLDPDQTILIAGSGVDLERFRAVPEPPMPPVRVVLPARMLRDKGVVEFAEAIVRVRSAHPEVEGWLAGPLDPDNPAALSAEDVASLESRCGVHWLGNVDDVPRLLADAHVVCLPSYREGLPRSLIEAAASARAVVTTDVPGCRDVVRHGENGLLVAPRDVAGLADALASLVTNRELRERFGAAGRVRAEREFGVDGVVDRTLALYVGLLP